MERLDFIPSCTVRNWVNVTEHEFSDTDWATIIYNCCKPLEERHRGLKALAAQTADEDLKKQIEERLAYDRLCWERFQENSGDCFYKVAVQTGTDSEEKTLGHFANVVSAQKAGREQELPFTIEKYQLADLCRQLITPVDHFNPRLCRDAEPMAMPYRGDPVARYHFRGDNIHGYYTEEVSKEERDRVEDWGERRFENRFVVVPHLFDRGDIVCSVDDPSWRGIVATSQEEWYEFLRRIRETPRAEDFWDASIVVEYLTAEGKFSHTHLSPMFLEEAELDPGDEKTPLLKEASRLLSGRGSMDAFSLAYEYYAAARKPVETQKRTNFYEDLFHQ